MKNLILSSFYIENFRIFNALTINKLSRVNLIVGRNNAGKSAFLEAVLLYISNASQDAIKNLIYSRQEHWDLDSQTTEKILSINPIRHFFRGHKIPTLTELGFKLGINKDKDILSVKTAAYRLEETEDRITRIKLDGQEVANYDSDIFDSDAFEIFVVAEHQGNTQLLFSQKRDFRDSRFRASALSYQGKYKAIQYVSTQGLSDNKAAQLWDAINLTDLEKDVISGLKLVEKKILGLAFVESDISRYRDRVPVVKLESQEERIPLKSLGDGVTRVFHIILSLVNAKNGVLLIDEFENGLHWTVQQSVWEVIFQLSESLNVQVFCTTHSRDCIDGFGAIWKKYPEKGSFFRLYEKDDTVLAKEYELEVLSDSLETDVEVR